MMETMADIEGLLDWYIMAGVQETCGDTPGISVSAEPIITNSVQSVPQKLFQSSANTVKFTPMAANISAAGNTAAVKNAKDICGKATSLQELKEIMLQFEGCGLKNTAASTVFGDGNPHARLMLIGEAPGADEDRQGKPFVGRCGKLLDKMFAAIQIKREDCYITNVLPWRPPGNRTPTDDEKAVCLPFLIRQIELIAPDFILLLGGIALNSVMNTPDSISRTRGKWMTYPVSAEKSAQVLATYHPSYLLRSPAQKANSWVDLLRLKAKMRENTNDGN